MIVVIVKQYTNVQSNQLIAIVKTIQIIQHDYFIQIPYIISKFVILKDIMGSSNQKQQQKNQIPVFGGRIIQILNPQLTQKMQPFTDFIISPSTQIIKQSQQQIEVTIFSILDYSTRKEILPIINHHIGIKIKQCKIKDCILRITKIFANSPCQKLGILYDQYIVGLVQGEYEDLKGFAEILKNLIFKRTQVITIAICNQNGRTRLIPIPLTLLDEWKQINKGILGCQLAEGWMNRFKVKSKKEQAALIQNTNENLTVQPKETIQKTVEQRIKEQIISNMNDLKKQQQQNSEQSQQIQRKCEQLLNIKGGVIQKTFKGLLKSEYLDDALTICKCKIYNKSCEKCFLEKENSYYFFNKKTNRIINISANLMFKYY